MTESNSLLILHYSLSGMQKNPITGRSGFCNSSNLTNHINKFEKGDTVSFDSGGDHFKLTENLHKE